MSIYDSTIMTSGLITTPPKGQRQRACTICALKDGTILSSSLTVISIARRPILQGYQAGDLICSWLVLVTANGGGLESRDVEGVDFWDELEKLYAMRISGQLQVHCMIGLY